MKKAIIFLIASSLSACVSARWKVAGQKCGVALQKCGEVLTTVTPTLNACLEKFKRDDLIIKTCDDKVDRLMKSCGDSK